MNKQPLKDEVFLKREKKKLPVFDVSVMFARKPKAGDIGIEIEVEGHRLPGVSTQEPPDPWVYKPDHSLRGDENGEYVLSKPIKFDDVENELTKLWKCFEKSKTSFDESNRTSVHVHLNCLKFHLNRLASFASLYFCFEDLLTHWCGEHRVGNLFCLRAVDAPATVSQLKEFFKSDGDGSYQFYDHLHYAAFNCHALTTFGSIEIRTMRGTDKMQEVLDWVNMLRRIYEVSASFPDPRMIIERFSELGPMAFLNEMMGPMAPVLRRGIYHGDQEVREALLTGIRFAQDIAYCREWESYNNIDLKPDPFGRDVKGMLNKIVGAGLNSAPTGIELAMAGANVFPAPSFAPEGHFAAPGQFQNEDQEPEDDLDLEF